MKRNIITIEGKSVTVTGNDVWMTAWEIGELFNVTTTAVNAAIRAILKTDVLNDFEVCRYVRLENGLNADVYSLEIIIPIAFRLNTYYTHVFRSWLLRKAYAKEVERYLYVVCADSQRRPLLRTEQTQARTDNRITAVRSCFWSEAI